MALSTYTELKAAVARWLWDRDDLTSDIVDFITMAEADFNSKLRVREMEASATVTLTSGSGSLPSDYLAWRRVLTTDSPVRELEWLEPSVAEDYFYADTAAGLSNYFTIIGANIKTYRTSNANVTLLYYQKIPALTGSNATNWLLTRCPQAYLYGALVHAAGMLDDDERIQTWGAMQRVALETLMQQDVQGRYAKSVARIKGATP